MLLVERVMAGNRGQDAAGLYGIEGFQDEIVVEGIALAAMFVSQFVRKRHVADRCVDAVLGQAGVAEVLNADVVLGM